MILQRWRENRGPEQGPHQGVLAAVGSRQLGQQAVDGALGSSHARRALYRTAAKAAGHHYSAALLAQVALTALARVAECLVALAVLPERCMQDSHADVTYMAPIHTYCLPSGAAHLAQA